MGGGAGMHLNGRTVAADTITGAATGAAFGSVVPGVGTVVGGAVGAGVGFLTGLLTGDSPDDAPPPDAAPPPLDLVDEIQNRAEIAKQARLMAMGAGTFVSGPGGDTSATGAKAPAAGGI